MPGADTLRMPPKERPADRGARLGRRIVATLSAELRNGRISAGLPQAAVAKALGVSRSRYGRLERGQSPNAAVVDVSRAFAVVGLELSARAYPGGSPLRDRAHLAVLERFGARLSPEFRWRTEVPLPGPEGARSWDGLARGAGVLIGIECEVRPTDWQELDRRIHRKKRDGAVDHVILLLPNTRSNRAFIRDHSLAINASFPVPGRAAIEALGAGLDPGGDALILF
jgi:transcriptional regulator with XRE-family HTH domain